MFDNCRFYHPGGGFVRCGHRDNGFCNKPILEFVGIAARQAWLDEQCEYHVHNLAIFCLYLRNWHL